MFASRTPLRSARFRRRLDKLILALMIVAPWFLYPLLPPLLGGGLLGLSVASFSSIAFVAYEIRRLKRLRGWQ